MKEVIRVVVVDDHLVVREGLRLIFEASEGIEVVGDAANGAEAIQLVEALHPDVVLMDLRMPGMDGLDAAKYVRQHWADVAVVILTTYNEDELLLHALHAGAYGYLLKDTSSATLLHAIRTAARGEILLQPEMMARVLAYTSSPFQSSPARTSSRLSQTSIYPGNSDKDQELTEREREVLVRVAQGEKSKEIASHLGVTESTIKAHLNSIYTKLGVDSRAAAVVIAIEKDILPRQNRSTRQ